MQVAVFETRLNILLTFNLLFNNLSLDQILSLHKQLPLALTLHEQTALERQIEATDRQIDALVYELYSLTEEEIEIVEGDRVHKR